MANYQHRKGVIRDNALEALLTDPLFKPRIEVNVKGKGSYRRKEKHGKKGNWEASGKCELNHLPLAFCFTGIKKTVDSDGFLFLITLTAFYCSALSADREFRSATFLLQKA